MGKFKNARRMHTRPAAPKKILKGETLIHKRGETVRQVIYLSALDKGLCKVINEQGRIESVPEFELIRGNDDDNRGKRQQRENTQGSGNHSSESGNNARQGESERYAS